ncbi:MAG: lytic transglycosylase domain-containing protein [Chthonomonadales bacterium]
MSIESARAAVAEIQARIEALSVRPPSVMPQPSGQRSGMGSPSVQPFDVSLAQAMGTAEVRPAPGRLSPEIEAIVHKYSAQFGVDPGLVKAVITAESGGDVRAVSSKGAMGLMQIMPEEVREYGIRDPFDPDQNILAGVKQLAQKLQLFHGDAALALAAYNAGSGAVRKYGGIPPYPETQKYVSRVLSLWKESAE